MQFKFKRGYYNTIPVRDFYNGTIRVDTVYVSRRAKGDLSARYVIGSICDHNEDDGFVSRGPLHVPISDLGLFVSTGSAPKRVR